jgi:hypothetical protein
MTRPLRNSAGVIVGSCDSGLSMYEGFDRLGRRPYRPRARPAGPRVAADINIEIDGPTMASQIKNYSRLR